MAGEPGAPIEVSSAGTAGGGGVPASEKARKVVRDAGVDLELFRSSALDRERIEKADLILVMDDGAIVERGTHDEMLALDGIYARMHARQLLEEALES